MSESTQRSKAAESLLADLPTARVLDLAARRESKRLSSIESLAMAILTGGQDHKALQQLLDSATTELGCHYRVPVQVVANKKRCKLFLSLNNDYCTPEEHDNAAKAIERFWYDDDTHTFVMSPGGTLQVIDVGDNAP